MYIILSKTSTILHYWYHNIYIYIYICFYCDLLFPVCCKQICYRLPDDGG